MPRTARKKSETGIYHVMQRGINRQNIFHDDEDMERYISTLKRFLIECSIELYGYCLMDNHIHLLLKEHETPVSVLMKKVGTSYVYWYNDKYERNGHLFQDRFRSEVVESDEYLLTVLRYIHNNPVLAGMVELVEEYEWSSYENYFDKEEFVSISIILGIFNKKISVAREKYYSFMHTPNSDKCLDLSTKVKLNDKRVTKIILEHTGTESIEEINNYSQDQKQMLYKYLLEVVGVSIRQLARITGESRSKVAKSR